LQVNPPTADELSVLLASQAHRFPEKHTISLPGDRGSTVRIPVLIGNPSGACKLPPGELANVAWSHFIAATFKTRDDSVELTRQAAADCLLWPPPAVWAQIVERWPAAPDALWLAAREKCGAALYLMSFPEEGEKPAPEVGAVLDRYERAVWRRLQPPGQNLVVVIDPPKSVAWTFFSEAMKKSETDRWKLVCEMAQMAVPAAFRVTLASLAAPEAYEPVSFVDDVMPQWPGFAVHVVAVQSQLAGMRAKVDRDGW
jgi:hypothetical protein